ncbi:hypothetical protein [Bacteroides reticulotermitis]|uniref:Uncharacterized protein n=2 Tax=Bacteroides reticulotermitis TaxID=1133319 RepID=W4UV87_9BACE|nr:hypothetical protein [Bacteroides reticulotermitis]MBB4042337.1 hypothetical protein [Bacteroides reticulotermitis]GAE85145.1 hypothetical protein JCM10512_3551 [Bacteroides reticulotermitis JCM 10512]
MSDDNGTIRTGTLSIAFNHLWELFFFDILNIALCSFGHYGMQAGVSITASFVV